MHQVLIELELYFLLIVLILQLLKLNHLVLTSLDVLLEIFDRYQMKEDIPKNGTINVFNQDTVLILIMLS